MNNIDIALKNLKSEHTNNWLAFNRKVDGVLNVLGERMGCEWDSTEDITDHVTNEDFIAAGFTPDEAKAFSFIMSGDDKFGRPVNNLEVLEDYFCQMK